MSDGSAFQRLINAVTQGASSFMEGARKSAEATRVAEERYPSVFNVRSKYHEELKNQGVSFAQTPMQATGAFATRVLTDLTNDGTRAIYWHYNHPLAALEKGIEKTIGKEAYQQLGPTKTGLLAASIVVPATALSGAYNILNPGQQFRPTGFSQSYTEEGSEDRRESSQPVPELFERFFLGRTGRPLKYETAKQEIPDLTPERYGNYLRDYYQSHGILGVIKATPENLEGVPEARVLGYPINIPSAAAAAGGLAGVSMALRSTPGRSVTVQQGLPGIGEDVATTSLSPSYGKRAFKRGMIGATAGVAAGALLGNVINSIIAEANRPKLPTLQEYAEEMQ